MSDHRDPPPVVIDTSNRIGSDKKDAPGYVVEWTEHRGAHGVHPLVQLPGVAGETGFDAPSELFPQAFSVRMFARAMK